MTVTISAGPVPPVIDSFAGRWAFLSSFWRQDFVYGGQQWKHREGAFQAFKTTDPDLRVKIARIEKPSEAKAAGRALVLRGDWDTISKRVMLDLMLAQFGQNPHMAEKLAATAGAVLVEGNTWHDQLWGDCRCGDPCHPECRVPGQNALGHLLMAVRFTWSPWAVAA
jgi:ribA/ribD-fused uncharacterized protein